MYNDLLDRWPEILDTFKHEYDISDVSFKTWIQPLELKSYKDNIITIIYPGQTENMGLKYIKKKYYIPLKVTIEESLGLETEVNIVLPDDASVSEGEEDYSIAASTLSQRISDANLNSKYTFDTFVVGSNNNIAQATSLAVAESPGEIYNPLFIYGGVGLGKTHLMHSIGNFVLDHNPDSKVLYTTCESFTNELIKILRNISGNQQEMVDFRAKYRNVDVLLIDDIQFINGKDRTQEEFFHTFQDLYMHKKAIVITSDRKPKDIGDLEDRLINRFESGLTVDIQSPDYETRMAILRKKAELEHYDISDEVLQYISDNVLSNIRELEGSLTKIIAFSKISHQPIDLAFAQDVLKDYISPELSDIVTCKRILEIVADHFGVSTSDIASKKKSQEFAYPRQICMYLCRTLTDETLETIGVSLHKKNHATVLHGVDKIKAEIEENPSTKATIDVLIKKISPK